MTGALSLAFGVYGVLSAFCLGAVAAVFARVRCLNRPTPVTMPWASFRLLARGILP